MSGAPDETTGFTASDRKALSSTARAQVLELRRTHSIRRVAEITGLPVGTVKTICSRSGAFRDNAAHRALFSLPALPPASASTAIAVPELPEARVITGDKELDALLWLRAVIDTGHDTNIAKAMEAAKRIKTPLKDLEKRYTAFLAARSGGNVFATFDSMGLADLQERAQRSRSDAAVRREALARFGHRDVVMQDTPAEQFCIEALDGLKPGGSFGFLDTGEVRARFEARPEYLPHTLSDCLHELRYWGDLYRLRRVFGACDIGVPEASERDSFTFGLMARIRPRSKDEAVQVLRHVADPEHDLIDREETAAILHNLVGSQ